jgi:ADP-ribosylglycohydrolase
MLGSIVGDVIGSVHEYAGTKSKDFPLFVQGSCYTDDSVLSVAVAEWILDGGDLVDLFHRYVHDHPGAGYGSMFSQWASSRSREPYNSYGNGSAMRASPVGFAFDSIDDVMDWSRRSALPTHDHAEGIRGAQATAVAVWLARRERDRDSIRRELESRFGYDLATPLEDIRPTYTFNETCFRTVPQALRAFLESASYEDAIRNAISLGGDADTLACIAGGVAEAYYGGVPEPIAREVARRLHPDLLRVVDRFRERHVLGA